MNTEDTSAERINTILLVEDDDDYAFSLKHGLEKYYGVDHARNEEEALRMLYLADYNLILLDLNLKDNDDKSSLSGFQFLAYFRRLQRFKNIPVIALSGMDHNEIIHHSSFQYLDAYLTKPVTIEKLVETIKKTSSKVAHYH